MMRRDPVLGVVTKFLVPLILLFALYVQFHGEYGPGGGFQAGVIFGSGFILYALVYGLEHAERIVPYAVLRLLAASGVLLYAGVGLATLVFGGEFLNYNVLAEDAITGQHIGIILIELGVLLTVASVSIMIFFAFAGRQPS